MPPRTVSSINQVAQEAAPQPQEQGAPSLTGCAACLTHNCSSCASSAIDAAKRQAELIGIGMRRLETPLTLRLEQDPLAFREARTLDRPEVRAEVAKEAVTKEGGVAQKVASAVPKEQVAERAITTLAVPPAVSQQQQQQQQQQQVNGAPSRQAPPSHAGTPTNSSPTSSTSRAVSPSSAATTLAAQSTGIRESTGRSSTVETQPGSRNVTLREAPHITPAPSTPMLSTPTPQSDRPQIAQPGINTFASARHEPAPLFSSASPATNTQVTQQVSEASSSQQTTLFPQQPIRQETTSGAWGTNSAANYAPESSWSTPSATSIETTQKSRTPAPQTTTTRVVSQPRPEHIPNAPSRSHNTTNTRTVTPQTTYGASRMVKSAPHSNTQYSRDSKQALVSKTMGTERIDLRRSANTTHDMRPRTGRSVAATPATSKTLAHNSTRVLTRLSPQRRAFNELARTIHERSTIRLAKYLTQRIVTAPSTYRISKRARVIEIKALRALQELIRSQELTPRSHRGTRAELKQKRIITKRKKSAHLTLRKGRSIEEINNAIASLEAQRKQILLEELLAGSTTVESLLELLQEKKRLEEEAHKLSNRQEPL
jgi:hypothetical protein